jgi:two-component system sensor histidine kinase KdpD
MPLVKIDFGLMEQILYNLIFNATQYAPVASDITLSAEHVNNFLVIKVSDNGLVFLRMLYPRF